MKQSGLIARAVVDTLPCVPKIAYEVQAMFYGYLVADARTNMAYTTV
jgi:hypothetical protein